MDQRDESFEIMLQVRHDRGDVSSLDVCGNGRGIGDVIYDERQT